MMAALMLVFVAVFILIVAGSVAYLVIISNRLARLKNDLDRAWASLDLLLKGCIDELPKLMGICRGYLPRDEKALERIVEARAAFQKAGAVEEKARAHKLLGAALENLFAAAARYPDLKANNNFRELQKRISGLEENIAGEQSSFNDQAEAFNRRISTLPDSLLARYQRFQPRALFEPPAGPAPRVA